MSNFALYMIGAILVTAGIIYGMYALGIGLVWIVIVAAIVIGGTIMSGVKKARTKDTGADSGRE
ncbi:MAG: hypothetical protein WAN36_12065 [Calditrichia bacterium]